MAEFVMCAECRAEYEDPADRRFHAQPIACPQCGPELELLDHAGRKEARGPDALAAAARAVRAGQVVALKGLGGFQLLVDATSADAVDLLRRRKRRPHRPFAVMFRDLEDARQRCEVSDGEACLLASPQAPIVLLRRRLNRDAARKSGQSPGDASALATGRTMDIAEAVAPGNPHLGVMLPYTPLHHLLIDAVGRPIVCTSGNLSEEPMVVETQDALVRLGSLGRGAAGGTGPIADLLLTHNRPIVRPVDDSVARMGPERMQVLRRARGFAPLPVECKVEPSRPSVAATRSSRSKMRPVPPPGLGSETPWQTILGVGGHLKNTVALGLGSQVVLSAHVGDLDNVLGVEVFRRAIVDLVAFFERTPDRVACDLHPDYASTRHAELLAAEWDVPLVRVQHHHAHVAACMAEHGLAGPVLGLSWDGTGYGPDGTVWGGEVLLCERESMTRVSHLRTFPLPGGDRAVREPRRSALGVLYEILRGEEARFTRSDSPLAAMFTPSELKTLRAALDRGVNAPRTSSLGRLFDAVAALCGMPATITFEGQAAMSLEFAADPAVEDAYPLPLGDGACAVADWEPLVRGVLADRAAGVAPGRISARFHNALADWAVDVARRHGAGLPVALTGGCFQNALLSERVRRRLIAEGFSVYTQGRIPPGDGGIALGQVLVASWQIGG